MTVADSVDTRAVSIDVPIGSGFMKRFAEHPPLSGQPWDDSRDSTLVENDQYARSDVLGYPPVGSASLLDAILLNAGRVPRAVMHTLAATYIDLATLSLDNRLTAAIDASAIIGPLRVMHLSPVSISPDLRMPRSKVQASSLLAPSGAYLTWVAMFGGDRDEHD